MPNYCNLHVHNAVMQESLPVLPEVVVVIDPGIDGDTAIAITTFFYKHVMYMTLQHTCKECT